jgi:hypothetical protein
MIILFRKIRQKMLAKNQFSKYLIYAIGEIILVVIGILIAIAINNKNEQRKEIKQEQIILKQLKEDYKTNLEQLENKIEMRREIIAQSQNILAVASNNITISADSLLIQFATLFMDPTFDPIDIDVVSSGNIKFVRNTRLKKSLSHWTSDIKAYTESEQIQHNHYISEIIPFMKQVGIMRNVNHLFWSAQKLRMGFLDKGINSTVLTPGESSKEINVESVMKNSNLEGLVTFVFTFSQVCNLEAQTLKKRMHETLEILEAEIKEE